MATVIHGVPAAGPFHLAARIGATFARYAEWRAARRERNRILTELSKFEDRDLRDLGLSRYDVIAIAEGRFKR